MVRSPGPVQDTEQFVRLFVNGQREIVRYILALVPDVDDANEVLQETAVDLWRKFDQYDPELPFAPWACRFALFRVMKYREQRLRRGKYLSIEAIEQVAAERPERDGILEDRRRALASCLKQLSEPERLMVEQRYSRRMPVSKISEITGRNVYTLYKALERLRRRLFECINRRLEVGSLR